MFAALCRSPVSGGCILYNKIDLYIGLFNIDENGHKKFIKNAVDIKNFMDFF